MGYKVTVLLPLTDNQGHPFDEQRWIWWNDQLTSLVAGFTDLGVVRGWWRGHSDRNRHLTMIVETIDEVNAIRNLLRVARLPFRQEAMYLEYHVVYFEEVT